MLSEPNQKFSPVSLDCQDGAHSEVTRIICRDIGTNDFLHFGRIEGFFFAFFVSVDSECDTAEEGHVLPLYIIPLSPSGKCGRSNGRKRMLSSVYWNTGIVNQVDRLYQVVEYHFRVQFE